MTSRVSFEAKDGTKASGALAEPPGAGPVPGLVLLQEYWGLDAHIEDVGERLAREGFAVLAPDLYHGEVTADPNQARRLKDALDTSQALREIGGAAAWLRSMPRSNGHVGVIGFCMGGGLALASACHVDGLGAVAAFYGIPPAESVDYAKVTAPIIGHYCKPDRWASVSKAKDVQQQLASQGQSMELHVYDAPHAFMNDTRPDVHDPASAKLAWSRTMAFLKTHLASLA